MRTNPGALFKGLAKAPTYSLRWTLLTFAVIGLGVAILSGVTRTTIGVLGGLAAFALLLLLGAAAQQIAQRSGAVERDRRREEELRAEMAGWPHWKRVAFLVFALLAGVGVILLRIWSDSFGGTG